MLAAIAQIITACAVAAGSVWALYIYNVTRQRHPQISLEIIPRARNASSSNVVHHITLKASNSGRVGVPKDKAFVAIDLVREPRQAERPQRLNDTFALTLTTYEVFREHTILEPGEGYNEDILISVPPTLYIQVRLRILSNAPEHTWFTSKIVCSDSTSPDNDCAQLE